jgi:hypothetical protein
VGFYVDLGRRNRAGCLVLDDEVGSRQASVNKLTPAEDGRGSMDAWKNNDPHMIIFESALYG